MSALLTETIGRLFASHGKPRVQALFGALFAAQPFRKFLASCPHNYGVFYSAGQSQSHFEPWRNKHSKQEAWAVIDGKTYVRSRNSPCARQGLVFGWKPCLVRNFQTRLHLEKTLILVSDLFRRLNSRRLLRSSCRIRVQFWRNLGKSEAGTCRHGLLDSCEPWKTWTWTLKLGPRVTSSRLHFGLLWKSRNTILASFDL